MKVIRTCDDYQQWRAALLPTATLGFVPTMGNLHQGHATLLQRARDENTVVALSIYVNPTQFNNSDDFNRYPKTLDADLELAQQLGVDAVFLPDNTNMYPDDFRFKLQENLEEQRLEGKARPGHFTGMLTIVMKLLLLTRPHRAYFGEKDYQQYLLIREMSKAFFLPIEIIGCETIRLPSGLPLSSRNNRLSSEQLVRAHYFAECIRQSKPLAEIITELGQAGIGVDYVEDCDNRRFAAVHIDSVRLIDNFELGLCEE